MTSRTPSLILPFASAAKSAISRSSANRPCGVLRELQRRAVHFDRQRDRDLVAGPLERRGERGERQAADRDRAVERVAQLRRRPFGRVIRLLRRCLRRRRDVAAARSARCRPGLSTLTCDVAEAAVALVVGRVVAEHVVAAVVFEDARERRCGSRSGSARRSRRSRRRRRAGCRARCASRPSAPCC